MYIYLPLPRLPKWTLCSVGHWFSGRTRVFLRTVPWLAPCFPPPAHSMPWSLCSRKGQLYWFLKGEVVPSCLHGKSKLKIIRGHCVWVIGSWSHQEKGHWWPGELILLRELKHFLSSSLAIEKVAETKTWTSGSLLRLCLNHLDELFKIKIPEPQPWGC